MKKLFLMFFMLSICVIHVFCQTVVPELTPTFTDLANTLVAKYPWLVYLLGGLWLLSEYLGKVKWTKANGVLQFVFGLFFKRKQLFGNADLNPGKPGGNG